MSSQCSETLQLKEADASVSHIPAEFSDSNVGWDSKDDPQNPMNWSDAWKKTIIILIAFATFNDAAASSIFTPGVPLVLEEFHETNPTISPFIMSAHVIGFATGALVFSPFSEIYGRCLVMHISNIAFFVCCILCAVSVNVPMLVIARILLGVAGSIPNALSGGFVADMIPLENRASSLALLTTGTITVHQLLTFTLGPIVGGYMTLNVGWRWTFWLETILVGCSTILSFFFLRETYAPVLLRRKAAKLGLQIPLKESESHWQVLRRGISRPMKLCLSPIMLIVSLYHSICYAYMYYLITTFPTLFGDEYGFNTGEVGLAYIGQGVGCIAGQVIVGRFADWYIRRQQARNGTTTPEDRLPPVIAGYFILAIGMVWFGWSAQVHAHFMAPIIGSGVVGVGIVGVAIVVQVYLVDTFTIYAASALAANCLLRSAVAVLLPLSGPAMYDRLGYGWGNTLLGLVALVIVPTPLLLMKYGERIRTRWAVAL
ncbi:major facilitator superfamily domain-containing protein [Aspergillus pseudotamarii]|uniref:Major facilitator superfamily domain-containing protein n=1 Tax=Aspergillus pseudotamarii TaxID=132259 RepID=A0A5N6STT8_ASPPS|nr:major facilitator superfamily domain-containing protein [Aspergillus pseudotamarii]KAE8138098.1 major facilitator superfamily domain-containing protein [Aspergillus pseudotamarii]